MKKYLYLVRHGETLFNKLHRIQGFCDSPLTDKGIAQAKATGSYFKKEKIVFDYVCSSTQERAVDTLELITSMQGDHYKGLKEWNFGDYEGESETLNPPHDFIRKTYGDYFLAYHGESDIQVQKRMCETLRDIMEQEAHNCVLAISHGGAIFMFLRAWVDEHTVQNISFGNCCILKFSYENGNFTYLESIKEHVKEEHHG